MSNQSSSSPWPAWMNLAGEEKSAPDGIFVLFGCSGDLAARKLAPALCNLAVDQLAPNTVVLGVGRRDWTDETFRNVMRDVIREHSRRTIDQEALDRILSRWCYQNVRIDSPRDYRLLSERLDALEREYDTEGSRLFYLAMAPEFFVPVAEHLGQAGLHQPARKEGAARIVLEKPFGSDLRSAQKLNETLHRYFDESRIFRIDHYLGKETVQNILAFRFANTLFDPHLNYQWVDNVQITTAEKLGMVDRRGVYYEQAGALRDMIQNHMLQLLSLIAMDRPSCLRCEEIRDAKVRLVKSIAPMDDEKVRRWTVRGQYLAGDDAKAYREEEGVADDSEVETFAAVRLQIDDLRWRGVPFYLRTGKRLAKKTSQIVVTFKQDETNIFSPFPGCELRQPNRLILRIAPEEGLSLAFDAKVPGPRMLLRPVHMNFTYDTSFASASPEAYEHLLLDAMIGDSTLFIRADEVEAAWSLVDRIHDGWTRGVDRGLCFYPPGSWGPSEAENLFEDPHKHWHPL